MEIEPVVLLLNLFNVTAGEIEPAVLIEPDVEIELFSCYMAGSICIFA